MCTDRDKRIRNVENLKMVDQRSHPIDGLSRSSWNAVNQTVYSTHAETMK